jgi:hypothetical protein
MNNENNLRTFLRLIAWRIVARWITKGAQNEHALNKYPDNHYVK